MFIHFMRKFFILFVSLFFIAKSHAKPLFEYETFTLDNGLQFILLQNKRAPIVSYTTWYKVGSADEIPGKTGLAHYLEHLMESALPEVQMGQFLEDFKSAGAHANAFTAQDYTFYYKLALSDHLELLMRYEAGRMRGVAFNKDAFETERNVILEERLMRIDNEPRALFDEKFNRQFFSVHPYRNPVIGLEEDIRALTLEDVKAFHKKWYTPSNAFVIVSGDFDPKEVKAWAKQYYGDIPSTKVVTRQRPQETLNSEKLPLMVSEHSRTVHPSLMYIYPLPDIKKNPMDDHLALLLLAEFLESDFKGSLFEALVNERKLATDVNVSNSFLEFLDPWSFAIYIDLISESEVEVIKEIINEKLQEIAENGLSLEDLNRARKYIENRWVLQSDDIYDKASYVGVIFSCGLTLQEENDLPEKLEKITSEDIQRTIQTYLLPRNAAVGIMRKPNSDTSSLQELS